MTAPYSWQEGQRQLVMVERLDSSARFHSSREEGRDIVGPARVSTCVSVCIYIYVCVCIYVCVLSMSMCVCIVCVCVCVCLPGSDPSQIEWPRVSGLEQFLCAQLAVTLASLNCQKTGIGSGYMFTYGSCMRFPWWPHDKVIFSTLILAVLLLLNLKRP